MDSRMFVPAIALAVILVTASCSKNDEAEILSYSITGQTADVEISSSGHQVTVNFPEGFTDAGDFVAEFTLSEGAAATVDGVDQLSGITHNNFRLPFTYTVESEDRKNIIEWKLQPCNNSYTLSWGLGGFLTDTKSNNCDYEWYIDQAHTGTYSSVNCGPSSTTMAAKWSFPSFSKTAEDARAAYRPAGGWWYTSDIDNYLTDNSIPHSFINLSSSAESTAQALLTTLDDGNIQILCVDMYYVRNESNTLMRVDKFYNTSAVGWGHFIVVKGYRKVDGLLYFEVYDPYSYDRVYGDGMLKGKGRYYRSEDIYSATYNWWNYAIVVSKKAKGETGIKGLDPAMVPVQRGR